nr:Gag-Pol polyprotein [Tanacetum cinerariifolium]
MMNTLDEYMILSGADYRPPMLDKDLYDSWKSRMELYMKNREHKRMILESVEHGPLILPTVKENGVIKTKKYVKLPAAEKIQTDCDMKATNIILQGIVEQAKAQQPLDNALDFTCKHAKRIQELLVYVKDTCPSAIRLSETKVAITPMNKIRKVTFSKPIVTSSANQETHDSNKPMLHSTGVKCFTNASGSKPSSNTKNNRISQSSSSNRINKVEDQPRSIKTRKNNKNHVNKVKSDAHVMQSMSNANSFSISSNNASVKTSMNDVKSGYLCAICGNCSQLLNFVSNFLGTVRFENDQIARIMRYCGYQLGNVFISRKNTCFIHDLEGVNLILGSRDTNLYTISLDDMLTSYSICLLSKASKTKSWLWHRRLSHLNFGTLNKLATDGLAQRIPRHKFQKDHLCLACAFGKSKKSSHQPKAKNKKSNLSFLHVFGSLCYPTNNHDDLGKFDAKADIGIFVGYAPAKKAFRIYNKRTRIITETIYVTFDELTAMASEQFSSRPRLHVMTPATPIQEAFAPRVEVVADSLVSISISQDAPSTSIPSSQAQEHSPIISQGSSSNVIQIHTPFEHLDRWTKAHPIANFSRTKELQTINDRTKGFVDQDNQSHMYKLKNALYGLKQAPRAWYDMLSSFLLSQQFSKGVVDPTLFTRHAGNDLLLDTRRSTSGSAQFLGEKLVSWSSKKQKSTAISSTKAEYIALSGCCSQILWMRSQLTNYGFQFNKIPLYCDNKSAIALCWNNVQHSRSKYIYVRYHFIKEQVENGIVELYFIRTEYQLADIFTKPLPRERFNFLIDKL